MRMFSKSLIAAGAIVSLGASAPVAAQAVQTDAYANQRPREPDLEEPLRHVLANDHVVAGEGNRRVRSGSREKA